MSNRRSLWILLQVSSDVNDYPSENRMSKHDSVHDTFLPLLEANRDKIERVRRETYQYGKTERHKVPLYFIPRTYSHRLSRSWTYTTRNLPRSPRIPMGHHRNFRSYSSPTSAGSNLAIEFFLNPTGSYTGTLERSLPARVS
jgi:hypothetical protein